MEGRRRFVSFALGDGRPWT